MKKVFYACLMSLMFITQVNAQSNYAGSGICLSFDGNAGNYIDLGDVFNAPTFPFTIEAWVKPLQYAPSYSAIFSSENDLVNATGFWISLTPTGQFQIEFGDGTGTGNEHTRGFVTVNSVPLNKWSHIAIVCKNINEVSMYLSGVLQSKTSTGGVSTKTKLTNSPAHASIGSHVSAVNESWFNGEIDEVRLWNKSMSQFSIRENLCLKINSGYTGLTGYWTSDESYSDPTVEDHTVPAENGNVVGIVSKVTSTAPLGDAIRYKYATNWFDIKVTLKAPAGDKLMTQDITGDGIYVYRVDAAPYNSTALTNAPDYYYGVFSIDVNTPASYNIRYKYSTSDGVVTSDNENIVDLMSRGDATQGWVDDNGIVDVNSNWITKHDGLSTYGEYTINIPEGEKQSVSNPAAEALAPGLSIYPNPSGDIIHLRLSNVEQSIVAIRILDAAGMVIQEAKETNHATEVEVNVKNLVNGSYIADVITSGGHIAKRFVVQK